MRRLGWIIVDLIGRAGCAALISAIVWPLTGHQLDHALAIGIVGGTVMMAAIIASCRFEKRIKP